MNEKEYRRYKTKDSQDAYRPHVIVKFKARIQLPYENGIEAQIRELIPELWKSIVDEFRGITLQKLFTSVEPERIMELEAKASKMDQSYKSPNLLSYFVVYTTAQIDPKYLVERLSSLDIVERAYVGPAYTEPYVYPVDDCPGYPNQGYLQSAPAGIDAVYAWTVAGGDGVGQRLIDLERGWTVNHEDLLCRVHNLAYGTIRNLSRPHGTGVLGIISACDNTLGCVGIAPHVASVDLASWHSDANIVNAMIAAVDELAFGNILLIEVQILTTPHYHPVEVDPANFDVIRLATALGIVVIEAAGNEGVDLDNYKSGGNPILRRSDPSFKDSGAIMVGAATSASRARWTYQDESGIWHGSNYGSRIDCYAWGENIWTTWSDEFGSTNMYISVFDGTSGASAIIAGAALSLQGMAEANLGRRFSPGQMRALLAGPNGTLSNDPTNDKIGVMPNLGQIVIHNLPDVYIRDFVGDTGAPHTGPIAASPDIIVLPAAVVNPQASFGQGSGTENNNSVGSEVTAGQDNFVYVRVNNRGVFPAANIIARVYWSDVASLIIPNMWHLIGNVVIPNVPPGVLTVSNAITWAASNVPPSGHYCFVCLIGNVGDPAPNPVADFMNFDYYYRFIRENNNVTWRNFNVISNAGNVISGELAGYVAVNFLVVGAQDKNRIMELEFIPQLPREAKVLLEMPKSFVNLIGENSEVEMLTKYFGVEQRIARIPLKAIGKQTILKAMFPAKARYSLKLYTYIPDRSRDKEYYMTITQKHNNLEVGAVIWKLVPDGE